MSKAKPRTCVACGKIIKSPGGPRTNTCSAACKLAHTKALKRARYERIRSDPAEIERRSRQYQKIAQLRDSNPEFAAQLRARQRLANKTLAGKRAADPLRYEEYKARQRAWKAAASEEQKEAFRDANRRWYASLSNDERRALIAAAVDRRRRRKKSVTSDF